MNRIALKTLLAFALRPLDRLASWPRTRSRLNSSKILIIGPDGIGDFVLWLPAAAALRNYCDSRRCQITLIANQLWAPLAREQSYFDEIWDLDRKAFVQSPAYRFGFLRRVAKGRFEEVINSSYSRDLLWGDAIVRGSGASRRVGFMGDLSRITPHQRRRSASYYTQIVASPGIKNELERQEDFVEALGLHNVALGWPQLKLPKILTTRQPEKYYAFGVSAGLSLKRWPARFFAVIADRIYKKTHLNGVLLGGPGDRAEAELIRSLCQAPIQDLCGALSLVDSAKFLQKASFTLANDSGIAHISIAVQVPTFVILGGGHNNRFMPWRLKGSECDWLRVFSNEMRCFGCNWKCIYPQSAGESAPCVEQVDVNRVWKAVESFVNISCESETIIWNK